MSDQMSILLIEDNPNDVELAVHAFTTHNLANRIEIARDGAEALELLFRQGEYEKLKDEPLPQVILLDLKLPKIDGLEVLRRIKGHPVLSKIPVVVLTSSQQESDLVRSYDLGVNSYIVKPVDFDQFTKAVQMIGFYWLLLNKVPEDLGKNAVA